MALTLKIYITKTNTTKTIQFSPHMYVYDALRVIRDKIIDTDASVSRIDEYGLFKNDPDEPRNSKWLATDKPMSFYSLQNMDMLDFKERYRFLKVKMLDEAVKTIRIDDGSSVGAILEIVCGRIGLSNVDEYSLVVDESLDSENDDIPATGTLSRKPKEKTGTIMRSLVERDNKQMEQLKRKLHTDDTLKWLSHTETLREQGVDESATVILRRKLFYELNANIKDPTEVNLAYVQCKDDIINGVHVSSMEEACDLGALQIQVQHGDFDESKWKTGVIDVKDFLPKDHLKKGVEKRLKEEHRRLVGLDTYNAKQRYLSMCQSLKTYGVTVFLVKEKMTGKNKLAPRLLGITKEYVMRMDEKTKEVLQKWPITAIKRWAASPKSFTLDFGDYQRGLFSVQTAEGEKMAQILSAYVDMTMRKRKLEEAGAHVGDEENIIIEDNVMPSKAFSYQVAGGAFQSVTGSVALPAVIRNSMTSQNRYTMGTLDDGERPISERIVGVQLVGKVDDSKRPMTLNQFSPNQRAFMTSVDTGLKALLDCKDKLATPPKVMTIGQDTQAMKWIDNMMYASKLNMMAHLAAMTGAAAQLYIANTSDADGARFGTCSSSVSVITSNLEDLIQSYQSMASLMSPEESNSLMESVGRLMVSFEKLMKNCLQDGDREQLISIAGEIGSESAKIMYFLGEPASDLHYQEELHALAKSVATATTNLVLTTKEVNSSTADPVQQKAVLAASKQAAISTAHLVNCTKVLAPTIASQVCQDQLVEVAKLVSKSVESVGFACTAASTDENLLKKIITCSGAVNDALNQLLDAIKSSDRNTGGQYNSACDDILNATDRLYNSMGSSSDMVKHAKTLAQASSLVVNSIKHAAEAAESSDERDSLLAAAKLLVDATSDLIEATKNAWQNPNETSEMERLRTAAEALSAATNKAAGNTLQQLLVTRLTTAARHTVLASVQFLSAGQRASQFSKSVSLQNDLPEKLQGLQDCLSSLIQSLKQSLSEEEKTEAHVNLIGAANRLLPIAIQAVSSSKAAIPMVSDTAAAAQLSQYSKHLATSCDDLKSAVKQALEASGFLEFDIACSIIRGLEQDLESAKDYAVRRSLAPVPGSTYDATSKDLYNATKAVSHSAVHLLNEVTRGNEAAAGQVSQETAAALKNLAAASNQLAALSPDQSTQVSILQGAQVVMHESARLIGLIKTALADPLSSDNQQILAQAIKSLSSALASLLNNLPGQKEIDELLKSVLDLHKDLQSEPRVSTESYQVLQDRVVSIGSDLKDAVTSLAQILHDPSQQQQLSVIAPKLMQYCSVLQSAGLNLASKMSDKAVVTELLRNNLSSTGKLLSSIKILAVDADNTSSKSSLLSAARDLLDSVGSLLDQCRQAPPGQKQCDVAVRNIEIMSGVLQNPVLPQSSDNTFGCFDVVNSNLVTMGKALQGTILSIKNDDQSSLVKSISEAAEAMVRIIQATAQATYLVGVSDPSSVPGREGVVNLSEFTKAKENASSAAELIINLNTPVSQLAPAASTLTKNIAIICSGCKQASIKATSQAAQHKFFCSAQDLISANTAVVHGIKSCSESRSDEARNNISEACRNLLRTLDDVLTFASLPEFSPSPAKISPEAKLKQAPLIAAGSTLVKHSIAIMNSTKQLALKKDDKSALVQFSQANQGFMDTGKKVGEVIKESFLGNEECDNALRSFNQLLQYVDQISLAFIANTAQPIAGNFKDSEQQISLICQQLLDSVRPSVEIAKSNPENKGHQAVYLQNLMESLVKSTIVMSSYLTSPEMQSDLMEVLKATIESGMDLIDGLKMATGNPKDSSEKVENSAINLSQAVAALKDSLATVASKSGGVSMIIDSISRALEELSLESAPPSEAEITSADYQSELTNSLKAISRINQDMIIKATAEPEALGPLSKEISGIFVRVSSNARHVIAVLGMPEVGKRICDSVRELGKGCATLIQSASNVQSDPTCFISKRQLAETVRAVTEKVSFVQSALQASSIGTQACIMATSVINGIVGDLDTALMFAQAHTLNPEAPEAFVVHRDEIFKGAKRVIDDTKNMVSQATVSQEQLGKAARSIMSSMSELSDFVKVGATSLGSQDSDAQIMLLDAVKEVSAKLSALLIAASKCPGKPANDPEVNSIKTTAKNVAGSVQSLLYTVRSIEDVALRGIRALETTVEAVKQAIVMIQDPSQPEKTAIPEDLVRCSKAMTVATAKVISAANSGKQEDIVTAANIGRKACLELVNTVKGVAQMAETDDIRTATIAHGVDAARAYGDMVQHIVTMVQKPSPEGKQVLTVMSKRVADAMSDLAKSSETLKGSDWVNPQDPSVLAEQELLKAAYSIEAAAKKLMQFRPRVEPEAANEELKFEDQIVEAAHAIMAAASILVKVAREAQKELVDGGLVCSTSSNPDDDGQWSHGLVSAARLVAQSTGDLCEAANLTLQGHGSEEKIIASAKAVSASTAQLLLACKVKADPRSISQKRLQSAGVAVRKATENLVTAAKSAALRSGVIQHHVVDVKISSSHVGGTKQMLDAMEEIARKERELTQAREKLHKLRGQQYSKENE